MVYEAVRRLHTAIRKPVRWQRLYGCPDPRQGKLYNNFFSFDKTVWHLDIWSYTSHTTTEKTMLGLKFSRKKVPSDLRNLATDYCLCYMWNTPYWVYSVAQSMAHSWTGALLYLLVNDWHPLSLRNPVHIPEFPVPSLWTQWWRFINKIQKWRYKNR